MKALTLIQPMGWAIVHGHKPFENRSRNILPVEMRGKRTRVAIHNGAKWDDSYGLMVHHLTRIVPPHQPMAIIGFATFTGRVFTTMDPPSRDAAGRVWFFGPFAFEIDTSESVAFAKPIGCRGALGFWSVPSVIERQVVEQARRAA